MGSVTVRPPLKTRWSGYSDKVALATQASIAVTRMGLWKTTCHPHHSISYLVDRPSVTSSFPILPPH